MMYLVLYIDDHFHQEWGMYMPGPERGDPLYFTKEASDKRKKFVQDKMHWCRQQASAAIFRQNHHFEMRAKASVQPKDVPYQANEPDPNPDPEDTFLFPLMNWY